jgi:hypothetical protein
VSSSARSAAARARASLLVRSASTSTVVVLWSVGRFPLSVLWVIGAVIGFLRRRAGGTWVNRRLE